MIDQFALRPENMIDVIHCELESHVALRYVDAQTGALRRPKLRWVLKLALGVMVSGNAADDD